jgi:hypothetical protein
MSEPHCAPKWAHLFDSVFSSRSNYVDAFPLIIPFFVLTLRKLIHASINYLDPIASKTSSQSSPNVST